MKTRLRVLAGVVVCLWIAVAPSRGSDEFATGWRPPSPEEQARIDATAILVRHVRLNRLGLERINRHRAARNLPPLSNEEVAVVPDGEEMVGSTADELKVSSGSEVQTEEQPATSPSDLPRAVDNSLLKYWPGNKNQGSLGSCAAVSSTSYTLTYMVARANDWSPDTNAKKLSPKFTGNIGGPGATPLNVMALHGCATEAEFPYSTSDATTIPATAAIWRSAARYRTSANGYIKAVDSPAGLLQLKTALLNGYILNFGTGAPGGTPTDWRLAAVADDLNTTNDNGFVGESIGTSLSANGSHAMTVVGYNDDIWYDFNANGQVEPEEKGALKIANTWASSWGNSGFVWLSYDALKPTSIVPDWTPPTPRVSAFWESQALWITVRRGGYTPMLMAECSLTLDKRNQLDAVAGYGPTHAAAAGFTNEIGETISKTNSFSGTIVFDLTDFADDGDHRWFVGFQDTAADGATSIVTSCKLTDGSGTELTNCAWTIPAGGYPLAADGTQVWAYTQWFVEDTVAPGAVTDLEAVADPAAVQLSWTAPGDDADHGMAAGYEIRYSAAPIGTDTWALATLCTNGLPAGPSGSPESWTFSGLPEGSAWHFALKAFDEAGHTGELSNVAGVIVPFMLEITTDTRLPAAFSNQAYSATLTATGGTLPYTWAFAPGTLETTNSGGVLGGGAAQGWQGAASFWTYVYPGGFTFPVCGHPTTTVNVYGLGFLRFMELDFNPAFSGSPMIYPFYGSSTTLANEDIFVDGNAERVIIRWCGHQNSNPGAAPGSLNFQVTLYPDGRFLYTYGDMTNATGPIGFSATMSDGSTDWSASCSYSGEVIAPGSTALFTPSTAGVLSGSPQTNKSYRFNVAVTDDADVRVTQRTVEPLTLDVEADSDLDGLPDDWETIYFLDLDAALGGPDEDWDGDGMNNWDEWIAGTVPTQAVSVLRLTGILDLSPLLRVGFDAVADRRYHVEGSGDLLSGAWSDWTNWYQTAAGPVLLDLPAPQTNAFIRLKVDP